MVSIAIAFSADGLLRVHHVAKRLGVPCRSDRQVEHRAKEHGDDPRGTYRDPRQLVPMRNGS